MTTPVTGILFARLLQVPSLRLFFSGSAFSSNKAPLCGIMAIETVHPKIHGSGPKRPLGDLVIVIQTLQSDVIIYLCLKPLDLEFFTVLELKMKELTKQVFTCSNSTMKTAERTVTHCSSVFVVEFEQVEFHVDLGSL